MRFELSLTSFFLSFLEGWGGGGRGCGCGRGVVRWVGAKAGGGGRLEWEGGESRAWSVIPCQEISVKEEMGIGTVIMDDFSTQMKS